MDLLVESQLLQRVSILLSQDRKPHDFLCLPEILSRRLYPDLGNWRDWKFEIACEYFVPFRPSMQAVDIRLVQ